MDEDLQFLYEERAAIKEFHGNMNREQAEAEAYKEVYGEEKDVDITTAV